MADRRKVLLVGVNRSWIQAFDELGDVDFWAYESHDSWAQRAGWTVGVDGFRGVLLGNYAQAAEASSAIRRWAGWLGVEAIVPGVEYAVRPASVAAADLGLPGLGREAAVMLSDKVALRTRCAAAGLPQPSWTEVPNVDELRAAVEPACVVKPSNLQASAGVTLVRSEHDVDEMLSNARSALSDLPASWPGTSFLVEELIEGIEISTEALVVAGEVAWLNVTGKHLAPGSMPVEIGHDVPAGDDVVDATDIRALVEQLVAAVEVEDGLLHAEWRIRDGLPHLIECAGRAPGDFILQMASDAWGFQVYGVALDVLTGGAPQIPSRPSSGAAIRYVIRSPGRVRHASLDGVDGLPGVKEARLYLEVDDEVRPLRSSWDRCGHLRLTAESVEEARRLADAYLSRLVLEVDTRGSGPIPDG
jgi:biotin carboxylase